MSKVNSEGVNKALDVEVEIQKKTENTPSISISKEVRIDFPNGDVLVYLYKDQKCRNRFSVNDGWCVLTGVGGGFGSDAEGVKIETDATGNWQVHYDRGSNHIWATVRAVMISPVG